MKDPNYKWLARLTFVTALAFHTTLHAQEPGSATQTAASAPTNNTVQAESSEPGSNATSASPDQTLTAQQSRGEHDMGPLISIGHDQELRAGDSAEAVVVVGGSAKIRGHVRQAAVVIFGDLDVEGEVGDAAVAILGNMHLGPAAKVHGQVVAIGGKFDAADTASISGTPCTVDFPDWLKQWFIQCVLKLRPLAPQVGWVWAIAGTIFLIYLVIAAVFPTPVAACVQELTRRPATTFLMGILAKLLLPLVLIILAATVIGAFVAPFILAAVLLAALVGKVAFLEWLGFRIGSHFGTSGLQNRLLALVIGAALVTLFYMVPILGLLVFAVSAVWGLGAGVTAGFGGLRKEMPEKAAPPPPPGTGAPGTIPLGESAGLSAGMNPMAAPGTAPSASSEWANPPTAAAAMTLGPTPTPVPEILAYPKAGFWLRMGAGFLDIVLVSILGTIVHVPPLAFLIALAYFSGMWAWKGTTIGGIVLGLKVVRTDGEPVSFLVALVRALAGAFAGMVLFLGILWIAWDPEKQGWHDKIAGTVVIRLPRGTPLVCL